MYLVLGSDCRIAKLHPLGSVLTLTALWAKVSFSSRILSYTLFISETQDTSDEELWRFDKISAKKKNKLPLMEALLKLLKWFRSKENRKTIKNMEISFIYNRSFWKIISSLSWTQFAPYVQVLYRKFLLVNSQLSMVLSLSTKTSSTLQQKLSF